MTIRNRPAAGSTHDDAVEQLLGNLLRWGVLIAAAVVAIGGVFYLMHTAGDTADWRVFRGEPESLRSVRAIVAGALALHPASIVQFGILLLLATPILRVAFSLVAFALQRDRLYIFITAIVLGLLLFSLLGGHGGHGG